MNERNHLSQLTKQDPLNALTARYNLAGNYGIGMIGCRIKCLVDDVPECVIEEVEQQRVATSKYGR
jgi:hypothetical protein